MAEKLTITQKIIQAKESGNPRIRGVAEEKRAYPGQITAIVAKSITITKAVRLLRRVKANGGFRSDTFF